MGTQASSQADGTCLEDDSLDCCQVRHRAQMLARPVSSHA